MLNNVNNNKESAEIMTQMVRDNIFCTYSQYFAGVCCSFVVPKFGLYFQTKVHYIILHFKQYLKPFGPNKFLFVSLIFTLFKFLGLHN